MKVLKIVMIVVATMIIVFFSGFFFLSPRYHIERSVIVKTSADKAYNYVLNYNNFNNWNPWLELDPEAKITISGNLNQPGSKYPWEGEKNGKGSFEIIELEPNKVIYQRLNFIEPFASVNDDDIFFKKISPNQTQIIWTMQGECNSLFEKWTSLFYDSMIGSDYEKGLGKLKLILEKS